MRNRPNRDTGAIRLLGAILALIAAVATGSVTFGAEGDTGDDDGAGKSDGPPYKNTLRWSTATEVDNFGFDIFRADKEEGPFKQINEDPVMGAGTTDVPTKYTYEDATIDPKRTYYYYVESISMGGVRERFTPVIKAKPKLPPDGSDASGDDTTRR